MKNRKRKFVIANFMLNDKNSKGFEKLIKPINLPISTTRNKWKEKVKVRNNSRFDYHQDSPKKKRKKKIRQHK